MDQSLIGTLTNEMSAVYQTGANCFSACLASILHMSIDQVFDIYSCQENNWVAACDEWLRTQGFYFEIHPPYFVNPPDGGYAIRIVQASQGSTQIHAVVDLDGTIVHDPTPPIEGYEIAPLGAIFCWMAIKPLMCAVITSECLETGTKPRAKVVRSFVTPERGKKQSVLKRNYIDKDDADYDFLVSRVSDLKQRLINGETIICRKGHPRPNRHYNDNDEISRLLDIGIFANGIIWCDDQFTYATQSSIDFAEDVYLGIPVHRSWEVVSNCTNQKEGTGDCRPLRIYSICWVDPKTHEPGLGFNCRVVEILELDDSMNIHCDSGCNGSCRSPLENNLVLMNEAGDQDIAPAILEQNMRLSQQLLFQDLMRPGALRTRPTAEMDTGAGEGAGGGGGGMPPGQWDEMIGLAVDAGKSLEDIKKIFGAKLKQKQIAGEIEP